MPRSSVILTFRRQRKQGAGAAFGLHNAQGLGAPLYALSQLGGLEDWLVCPGLEGSLKAVCRKQRQTSQRFQSPRNSAVARMGAESYKQCASKLLGKPELTGL